MSMKEIVVFALLFIGLGAAGAWAAPTVAAPASVEGTWQGALQVPGGKLRIVFHLTKGADGALGGTLDSPDQGAKGIPLGKVTEERGTVRIEVPAVGGSFEGKRNPATGEITGQWKQGGAALPLILKRVDKAPEVRRPQEPKPPYPYREEQVVVENARAGVRLAGTLTLPQGAGPFPAALLISGSGPQDRDETIFGHKPFRVLADYLTRRGIAVLRLDDRGVGASTGNFAAATSQDFAGDAAAALAYLRGRKEVRADRVGLIGHSEGGIIAPMVAVQHPGVAFLVLIAAPGMTGEEILYAQGQAILKASGAPPEALAAQRALQAKLFQIVKTEPDRAAAEAKLREVVTEAARATTPDGKLPEGADVQINAQIQAVLSPWFRFFLTHNPVPVLKQVRVPALAITGEKDLQVPPDENLRAIEEALKAGGNKDIKVVEMPGLNHLLQTAQTGLVAEYATIEETMAPAALKVIGDWIVAHA